MSQHSQRESQDPQLDQSTPPPTQQVQRSVQVRISQPKPQSTRSPQSKKPRPWGIKEKVAIIVAVIAALATILAAVISGLLNKGDLQVWPHPTISSTTATPPSPSTYPPTGWKPVYDDPMNSNSSGYWRVTNNVNGSCQFTNDAYQVSSKSNGGYDCYPAVDFNYVNFAIEAQMAIVQGDEGALLFRADTNTRNYYSFWISRDGKYGFEIWANDSMSGPPIISHYSPVIHTGPNQRNTIAVLAQENTFRLYVNGQLIDTETDPAYNHGTIAFDAYSENYPTQVRFSNVKVWEPSSPQS